MLKIIGALALVSTLGCTGTMFGMRGKTHQMLNTGKAEAAEGKIKVANAKYDNTALRIEVKHLAEPERVAPGTSMFVAWAKPESGPVQKLGVFRPGDNKKATIETTTPLRSFDVMITPEQSPDVASPKHDSVLETHIER